MSDAIYSYKIDGLEKILKALRKKPPVCRVGILGDSTRKPKEGEKKTSDNATIGAAHEFGTEHIPQRSFLRMPIAKGLNKEMEKSNLFDKDVLKEVIRTGSLVPWMEKAATCAEACVQDAFDQGGPGWPQWKDPNYSNNAGQLLVDTKQLRESITSEVKES